MFPDVPKIILFTNFKNESRLVFVVPKPTGQKKE